MFNELGHELLSLKLERFNNVDVYADEYRHYVRDLATHEVGFPEPFLILLFKMEISTALQSLLVTVEHDNGTIITENIVLTTLNCWCPRCSEAVGDNSQRFQQCQYHRYPRNHTFEPYADVADQALHSLCQRSAHQE